MVKPFLAGAACLLFAASAAAQTPARSEIEIRATTLPDHAVRYAITINLAGAEIDTMLDTGSAGLRILDRALPANGVANDADDIAFAYGGGAELRGNTARASLAIGVLGSEEIAFERVRAIACSARRPDCPAGRVPFRHYGIGGDGIPDQGFAAILGVGLRAPPGRANAPNPLPLLGASTWIVELPRDERAPGRLVLNPSENERAGFVFFQLPHQGAGWGDNALPACLRNAATQAELCLPTLLDTGAPGFHVLSAQAFDANAWTPGANATLSFQQSGADVARMSFPLGRGETRVSSAPPMNGARDDHLVAGTAPYAAFLVFYDAEHGVIGLKPRT